MAREVPAGVATLALLEARLKRVNFVLTGDTTLSQEALGTSGSTTAASRLRTLERHLQTLSTRCEAASEVLALHAKHPDIFHPSSSAAFDSSLQPAALAATILSHAQQYQQLATNLDTCRTRTLPESSMLVPLVDLRPRISKVAAKQAEQTKQLAQLRTRSAQALEAWYTRGVLEMSECWADWEERLKDVEILVRRMEAAKRREDGFV